MDGLILAKAYVKTHTSSILLTLQEMSHQVFVMDKKDFKRKL